MPPESLVVAVITVAAAPDTTCGQGRSLECQSRPSGAGVCLTVVTGFAWVLAPIPESAKASAPAAESPLFIDRPDFFDYPDSDQAKLLAVAQFIGERPVLFVNSGSSSGLFHHILVGALVVAFFFILFQFCTHM
ncbi:LOW QUALITY PROTEIN: fertilization-influencing membrane protein [Cynocephalus volans]|uniref:LOW QUALITY PROTEIN: fertilization-influencing membrane protein n=1 Tax=Cynocephalus volans TaxID=110931 RepID=UPI002FC71412